LLQSECHTFENYHSNAQTEATGGTAGRIL
jgi:hypothetical protein